MSVYLDHNATTPMRDEVRALMRTLADLDLGNPSSLHASGRRARQIIDSAREQAAAALGVHEDALSFTSGGTEANNLAILGTMRAGGGPGKFLSTAIEHSSVLGPAAALSREGHSCELVPVDAQGRVDVERLCRLARGARLVSVMAANNEIGTCPPLARIAAGLPGDSSGRRPLLHSDAAQALGRIELPFELLDLVSLSGHKFGGPLGVGLLVHRQGLKLEPILHGGGQESGLRPGTENCAGIAGLALALELACRERAAFASRVHGLAVDLWRRLSAAVPELRLVGPPLDPGGEHGERLPGTLNVIAPTFDGKVLLTRLDLEGLEVSAGSACASGSLEASHVLLALGLDESRARAGLRLSLGRATRAEDVDRAVEILRRSLGNASAR